MRFIFSYSEEDRILDAPSFVTFKYDTSSRLISKKRVEIRNNFVDTNGSVLEELLPTSGQVDTLQKIRIEQNGVLVKEITTPTNLYYVLNSAPLNAQYQADNPTLTEFISVEV